MTPSLSETLEPPSTTAYGRFGRLGQPLEHLDLRRDQAAGAAAAARRRRRRWPACGARRRSRRTRSAVAADDGELLGERASRSASSLLVSPGSKRRFSSSSDVAVGQARRPRLGASCADDVVGELRRACPAAHRAPRRPGASDSTSGRARPSGRPRCAVTTTLAPASASALIVGTDARDPAVVGDRAVLERHVQVGAHQHAACRETPVPEGRPGRGSATGYRDLPTSATRSTRRLE